MAVLKRVAGLALAIGATGAVLAPATPAAERGAGGSDERAPAAPQARSSAADGPVVSTDQDALPTPRGNAGGPARGLQGDPAVARAAASNSVTISDFKFSPKSITVNVGDTVAWTNEDSQQHSATSKKGGSFDTGLLQKGESGSFTFDKAGTYAYVCTPHTFMKGTVKVVAKGSGDSGGGDDDAVGGGASAADTSSGDGTSGGNGSASGAGDGTGASGPSGASGTGSGGDEKLADTGTDSLLVAATGLGLLLCGFGLRLLPRRA